MSKSLNAGKAIDYHDLAYIGFNFGFMFLNGIAYSTDSATATRYSGNRAYG